ncbi:hypothetical protein [Streptomyces sp. NPDC005732]|uniref:hypothetical protein n=1 Tax=Streptomyces sp. NPDC005732 TaxID=3157057 RepID=UPI0033F299EA
MSTATERGTVPDEDHSTGAAWRDPRALPPHMRPCTPEEQAQHVAELDEGLSGWVYDRAARRAARGDGTGP